MHVEEYHNLKTECILEKSLHALLQHKQLTLCGVVRLCQLEMLNAQQLEVIQLSNFQSICMLYDAFEELRALKPIHLYLNTLCVTSVKYYYLLKENTKAEKNHSVKSSPEAYRGCKKYNEIQRKVRLQSDESIVQRSRWKSDWLLGPSSSYRQAWASSPHRYITAILFRWKRFSHWWFCKQRAHRHILPVWARRGAHV